MSTKVRRKNNANVALEIFLVFPNSFFFFFFWNIQGAMNIMILQNDIIPDTSSEVYSKPCQRSVFSH